jgi:hypothetical protein
MATEIPGAERTASSTQCRKFTEMEPELIPIHWLMLVFLVSVFALLAASAGMAHHVWRERGRSQGLGLQRGSIVEPEIEEAP